MPSTINVNPGLVDFVKFSSILSFLNIWIFQKWKKSRCWHVRKNQLLIFGNFVKFLDRTKDNLSIISRKLSTVPKSTKKVPGIPQLRFEEGTCRSLNNVEVGMNNLKNVLPHLNLALHVEFYLAFWRKTKIIYGGRKKTLFTT